ncbi:hypothetical protein UPYG_G00220190 [Umbra pygmaea]|uniref:Uncharacterized protein n=1 Tax=Umbra pygmaea TaxID=75934 RepID=A0ABD0X1V2_UMBPY
MHFKKEDVRGNIGAETQSKERGRQNPEDEGDAVTCLHCIASLSHLNRRLLTSPEAGVVYHPVFTPRVGLMLNKETLPANCL